MRDMILACARRCKKNTNVKRAFLRAIGIDVPVDNYLVIHVDESKDIRDCFKNERRVKL